ncbi:NAD-binding protein [Helicobacter ibis]|uniref:NAD-binding protein n=1 Tax=Helicobacter ibis TaxID=2962633 RepID=UPI002A4E27CF|nr:NAD-binding protein [Helicobacter ibis]
MKDLADKTDMVFILNSTDVNALKEAGFSNLDFVIVSIGENIESSILTLMTLKKIGVKNIIAKAITTVHGSILSKLGASKVIYPEREALLRTQNLNI